MEQQGANRETPSGMAARVGRSLSLLFAALLSLILIAVAYSAIRGSGHSGPMPAIFALFMQLNLSVSVFLVLKTILLWVPDSPLVRRLASKSGRKLGFLGVVAFASIAIACAFGIAYALGII